MPNGLKSHHFWRALSLLNMECVHRGIVVSLDEMSRALRYAPLTERVIADIGDFQFSVSTKVLDKD